MWRSPNLDSCSITTMAIRDSPREPPIPPRRNSKPTANALDLHERARTHEAPPPSRATNTLQSSKKLPHPWPADNFQGTKRSPPAQRNHRERNTTNSTAQIHCDGYDRRRANRRSRAEIGITVAVATSPEARTKVMNSTRFSEIKQ